MDAAGIWLQRTRQQPEQRRLACPLRAKDANNLAPCDLERSWLQGCLAAVGLGKRLDVEHVAIFVPGNVADAAGACRTRRKLAFPFYGGEFNRV